MTSAAFTRDTYGVRLVGPLVPGALLRGPSHDADGPPLLYVTIDDGPDAHVGGEVGGAARPRRQGAHDDVFDSAVEGVEHVDLKCVARQVGMSQHCAFGRAGRSPGVLQQREVPDGR